MGQIVGTWNKYPGLYCKNYRPELRFTVKHIFGTVTQLLPTFHERISQNKDKALLVAFLRYNSNLHFQELNSMQTSF